MDRIKVATVWLAGCAGCHMSFLDLDEFLIDLAGLVDVVYSPIVDIKEFPEGVDVTLVEGAVANEDNLEVLLDVRRKSRLLVALGDCALTGNVPAMRNPLGDPDAILHKVYVESADLQGQTPRERGIVPALLPKVRPLHEVVSVDAYIRGCPPTAREIRAALEQILASYTATDSQEAVVAVS